MKQRSQIESPYFNSFTGLRTRFDDFRDYSFRDVRTRTRVYEETYKRRRASMCGAYVCVRVCVLYNL